VKKLLQQALEWKALLDSGQVLDQAEIARKNGLSRARVTQIMSLLRLAPEIQEHLLSVPETAHQPVITERVLRPITQIEDQKQQVEEVKRLLGQDS